MQEVHEENSQEGWSQRNIKPANGTAGRNNEPKLNKIPYAHIPDEHLHAGRPLDEHLRPGQLPEENDGTRLPRDAAVITFYR